MRERSERFGLGVVLGIVAGGIVLIALNVLDIYEDFRIRLPTSLLNTMFISAVAVPVAYGAARSFTAGGPAQVLWLGCGALAFGAGNLLRSWLVADGLNAPITILDTVALLASLLHVAGAVQGAAGPCAPVPGHRLRTTLLGYFAVLASVALLAALAVGGAFPPFYIPGESPPPLRVVVLQLATGLFIVAAFLYLRACVRSRACFAYWYSLGLVLLGAGLFFMSQGPVDSTVAWLGRASQYVSGLYLLVAVSGARPAVLPELLRMHANSD